jgi:hypothetical protein
MEIASGNVCLDPIADIGNIASDAVAARLVSVLSLTIAVGSDCPRARSLSCSASDGLRLCCRWIDQALNFVNKIGWNAALLTMLADELLVGSVIDT